MHERRALERATEAYERARRKAFLGRVLAATTGRSNRLLAFSDIGTETRVGGPVYRGLQAVELSKIVGSVDRYTDFDRAFMPIQEFTRDRWQRVGSAYFDDIQLPPVTLYKLGDAYFVIDGNHRISVAHELGREFIDAEVYEFHARVPITPDMEPEELTTANTLAGFLAATRLDEARPESDLRLSEVENYTRLLEHIQVHRYFRSIEDSREFSFAEAAESWHDRVYQPIVGVIRATGILRDFPNRTEADLYLWLAEHLHYLRERHGQGVDLNAAARSFADRFTPRVFRRLWRGVARWVAPASARTMKK